MQYQSERLSHNYAFAALQVADPLIVQVAAQKALISQQRRKLITKSLHAELVYNMSGSRHVSLSLLTVDTLG